MDSPLKFDTNAEAFYFEKSLNIDAINNETQCSDRKAHLFWEIPVIDAKINELMSALSDSGKAASRLIMTGDSKDGRQFFTIKRKNKKKAFNTN